MARLQAPRVHDGPAGGGRRRRGSRDDQRRRGAPAPLPVRGRGRAGRRSLGLRPTRPAVRAHAGRHDALRHRDPPTGCEHHGFLDVVLATSAALDGGPVDDVTRLMAVQDPGAVTGAVRDLAPEQVAGVRRQFVSSGTSSVDEPVADLLAPGLLTLETAP